MNTASGGGLSQRPQRSDTRHRFEPKGRIDEARRRTGPENRRDQVPGFADDLYRIARRSANGFDAVPTRKSIGQPIGTINSVI